ncbi:MAG: [protein-PII] uridylyltransferase, partial [Paracoccaceae bacterium]
MTLPQEALVVPVSESNRSAQHAEAPDDLICPASAVFDINRVRAEIDAAVAKAQDRRAVRRASVLILQKALELGRANIAAAFVDRSTHAHPTVLAYAYLTDCVIRCVLDVATRHLHPLASPTEGERLALLAVGGYGRAEMAPYSDVDLLFLVPYKLTAWAESVIESMLYMLWDLHLKVGHASRTVKECIRLAREDFVIRTALLEHRFLDGHRPLADELAKRLQGLFRGTARDFIEAKLAERAERHRKQGGQRYMVEPNVKEGKGGLRDLQSLFWI